LLCQQTHDVITTTSITQTMRMSVGSDMDTNRPPLGTD